MEYLSSEKIYKREATIDLPLSLVVELICQSLNPIHIGSLKGALDKYNIYLFKSNSIEDFKLNQYRNFQLILSMRFHFMM